MQKQIRRSRSYGTEAIGQRGAYSTQRHLRRASPGRSSQGALEPARDILVVREVVACGDGRNQHGCNIEIRDAELGRDEVCGFFQGVIEYIEWTEQGFLGGFDCRVVALCFGDAIELEGDRAE